MQENTSSLFKLVRKTIWDAANDTMEIPCWRFFFPNNSKSYATEYCQTKFVNIGESFATDEWSRIGDLSLSKTITIRPLSQLSGPSQIFLFTKNAPLLSQILLKNLVPAASLLKHVYLFDTINSLVPNKSFIFCIHWFQKLS